MADRQIKAAPDYTDAALTMLGINLMWIFFVVWMLWGFIPVLVIAVLINHFAERVADRRGITPAFAFVRLNRRG